MLNAPKLHKGDKIMIVAPSRGLKLIGADCRQLRKNVWQSGGLRWCLRQIPQMKIMIC